MKTQIVNVMKSHNFELLIEEDNGLMFEGPIINQRELDVIDGELYNISKNLDIMVFQSDSSKLLIAVFYEELMV